MSKQPLALEFIEVKSNDAVGTESRRRIRSQAARAGNHSSINNTHTDQSAGQPVKPAARRSRSRRPIVFPLVVQLATAVHVHVQQTNASEAESIGPTEPEQDLEQKSNPGPRPVGDEYLLVPFAGNDTMVPISQSELYPLPFLSLVLNNYLQHLAVAIPEVDGPTESGLLKKSWFPMVLHSKVLFQIIVLFSASHFVFHQGNPAGYFDDILFVKHCALRDLREAVHAEGCVNKDETVAAVAKMASYEAVFGTEETYHVHMDAVARMLKSRGGLSKLGLNGFLARLLVFIDTNSAFLLNTKLHLTESSFPRKEPWTPPNPGRFLGSPEHEPK